MLVVLAVLASVVMVPSAAATAAVPDGPFAIQVGDTVSNGVPAAGAGLISEIGEVDAYTFDGVAGTEVFLERLALDGTKSWSLANPDDSPLIPTTPFADSGRIELPQTGTYSLLVDGSVGTYSFHLAQPTDDGPIAISVGDTVAPGVPVAGAGVIDEPSSTDLYTFSAAAGDRVYLDLLDKDVAGTQPGKLSWRLRAPSDEVIHGGTARDVGPFQLAETGTYSLVVVIPDGTGTYSFRVAPSTDDHCSLGPLPVFVDRLHPMGCGAGDLEEPGSRDTYSFSGTSGLEVVLERVADGVDGSGPVWWLTAPDGETMPIARMNWVPSVGPLVLPQTGMYELVVQATGGSGTYALRIYDPATPPPLPSCGPNAVDGPFSDVDPASVFCHDIEWLVDEGIAGGFADGTYRPTLPVSRQVLAAFLHQMASLHTAEAGVGALAPACTEAPFSDVPVEHPFCPAISWMVDAGIARGRVDGSFGPTAPVSRGAMAAFLAARAEVEPEACGEAPFDDVPAEHIFCGSISWLADASIASGYGDGTYRPASMVARGAMAAFLRGVDGYGVE